MDVREFCSCLPNYPSIRISILPKREKLLVGVSSFLGVRRQYVRPPKLEIGKSAENAVGYSSAMIQNILKLSCRLRAFSLHQVCLAAQINGIECIKCDGVSP